MPRRPTARPGAAPRPEASASRPRSASIRARTSGAFGDGGAVVTDDAELERRIRCLADHGRSADAKHEHPRIGRNSRLDALQAGVLSAKLRRLEDWNARRRAAAAIYDQTLDPAIGRVELEPGTVSAHHLFVVRVPRRDRVRERLDDLGVRTGIHYPVPCHLQPPYRRFATAPLPEAERAAGELLSLPMFPTIEAGQIARGLRPAAHGTRRVRCVTFLEESSVDAGVIVGYEADRMPAAPLTIGSGRDDCAAGR